ncbi:MAG: ribosome silencing factor [Planctomycetes bacterium]|nr:ribosome silencing factor [Planctomycetota bacterium]
MIAAVAAWVAEQKKGTDIRVYDVSEHLRVADYFVIVTGHSRPHVKAIYDAIHVQLKALGEKHGKAEGTDLGWWVLVDYVDVVIHVLQPEAREYYDLDGLYTQCPQLDVGSVRLPVQLAQLEQPAARMAE